MTTMNLPRVVDLLSNGMTLRDLERNHHVDQSICQVTGKHVALNYNSITSPADNAVANECRGLILANANARGVFQGGLTPDTRWNVPVVCSRPMDRFFNYGHPMAAKVDFSAPDTKVQEKLDGTMCQVWYDPDSRTLEVGTRSVPRAQLPVDGHTNWTFGSLFWEAVSRTTGKSRDQFSKDLAQVCYPTWGERGWTAVFELCTPYNQVLVSYPTWKVVLLAVRGTQTGKEGMLGKRATALLGVERPVEFFPTTETELIAWVNGRPFSDHEGVVVLDRAWNRVKVKSEQYCVGHRTRFAATPKNLLCLVLLEKDDDVVQFLNEAQRDLLAKIREVVGLWCDHHDRLFQETMALCGPCPTRKSFASVLNATHRGGFKDPVFRLFEGSVPSTRGWIDHAVARSKLRPDGEQAASLGPVIERILTWGGITR